MSRLLEWLYNYCLSVDSRCQPVIAANIDCDATTTTWRMETGLGQVWEATNKTPFEIAGSPQYELLKEVQPAAGTACYQGRQVGVGDSPRYNCSHVLAAQRAQLCPLGCIVQIHLHTKIVCFMKTGHGGSAGWGKHLQKQAMIRQMSKNQACSPSA